MKTKEALERQIANAEEQERKVQERLANAEKNSNDKIAALEKQLAEAEAAKLRTRNDDMQAQMSEMMALMKGLDTKTDAIMGSVNTTLSSLQNFYTGVSEVPRYILIVPFAKKTESTTGKLSRFFSAPKEFFLSEPTAKLVILCSHDFSAVVDFEIEEPKQFVKDHAATIKMTLKGLRMMSQVAGVGAKILTGASLPFELPSTETFDSFLDSAEGMLDGALEIAGEEGSEEREAVRKINDGGDVEGIKKVVGAAYRKLKDYLFQDEERMATIRGAMEQVRGSDGIQEWVRLENLDSFHSDRQEVMPATPVSKPEKLRAEVGAVGGLTQLLETLKKRAKGVKKSNPLAKRLFKALSAEEGADFKIVLSELDGEDMEDVDARYADALEVLED
jgi:hypothetical protein